MVLMLEDGGIKKQKKIMRRTAEEQAEYMLEKMTVDMTIDYWQTKECALAACEICIDAAIDTSDGEKLKSTIAYWKEVKRHIQEKR
jgi:hypothetical protein